MVVGFTAEEFPGGWEAAEPAMVGGVRSWPALARGGAKADGGEAGFGLTKLVRRPGETWR